ncbi:MAG: hypothetical protein ABR573_09605 [Candidatus Dormibacteria bacterium]
MNIREGWESLTPRTQAVVAFPVLALATFVLNLVAFAQPLVRAIIYGIIEGGGFTAFAIIATRNEIARRRDGGAGR